MTTLILGDGFVAEFKKYNTQSLGEEIANAVSHGVGSLLSIAAAVVLIVRAAYLNDAMGVVGACIFGASLILLYTFSSIYHSLTNFKAKYVFQIFDHCSIFILILGTYTPICFTVLRGAWGWTLFGINALCTVVGIVFNSIDLKRWNKISLVLYVIMGWSVLVSGKTMLRITPPGGLALLVIGGIAYTVGIIFYKMKKVKYMHFVWHLFVLAGSILHYFYVLFYCYR